MARSRLRRISSLTERDAPRGSKSGMPLSSPRVRGLECAEDCIDVLDVISVPFRSPRLGRGPHHRSEEHTSELQSRRDLVCRLLLEKKKKDTTLDFHFRNSIKKTNYT